MIRIGTIFLVLLSRPASAEDHFLILGGGYSPRSNPVSFEAQVMAFEELAGESETEAGGQRSIVDIFFGDGDDPAPDLFQWDKRAHAAPARSLLQSLLANDILDDSAFRNHRVPGVAGALDKRHIEHWFHRASETLKRGDRLTIFVAAHGGREQGESGPPQHYLQLWNDERLDISELAALLAQLDDSVPLRLVMTPCYAGGFADLLFEDANPENGLAERTICGFFATTRERPATGCVPESAAGRSYAHQFIEALKQGGGGSSADFDGDGRITLVEAHARVLLAADSIDVPVKTSEVLLRKLAGRRYSEEEVTRRVDDVSFPALLANASAADRAVLAGLSADLQLDQLRGVKYARHAARRLQRDLVRLDSDYTLAAKALEKARRPLVRRLKQRWPQLETLADAKLAAWLDGKQSDLLALLQEDTAFAEFQRRSGELDKIAAEQLRLERRWARHRRFIRTAETVALAELVVPHLDSERRTRLMEVQAAEASTLPPER